MDDWFQQGFFATGVVFEQDLFKRLLSDAKKAVDEVERRIADAEAAHAAGSKKLDDDDWEHLGDQRHEANSFATDVAELVAVAIYHWVERTLKVEARRLAKGAQPAAVPQPSGKKQAAKKAPKGKGQGKKPKNSEYDALKTTITDAVPTVDWKQIPNERDVDLLRLFANSWKHEPIRAATPLAKELKVNVKGEYGLLSSDPVRIAIATRLGIPTNAAPPEVVACFLERSAKFLLAVGTAIDAS
jgi:hypothetical protein